MYEVDKKKASANGNWWFYQIHSSAICQNCLFFLIFYRRALFRATNDILLKRFVTCSLLFEEKTKLKVRRLFPWPLPPAILQKLIFTRVSQEKQGVWGPEGFNKNSLNRYALSKFYILLSFQFFVRKCILSRSEFFEFESGASRPPTQVSHACGKSLFSFPPLYSEITVNFLLFAFLRIVRQKIGIVSAFQQPSRAVSRESRADWLLRAHSMRERRVSRKYRRAQIPLFFKRVKEVFLAYEWSCRKVQLSREIDRSRAELRRARLAKVFRV